MEKRTFPGGCIVLREIDMHERAGLRLGGMNEIAILIA